MGRWGLALTAAAAVLWVVVAARLGGPSRDTAGAGAGVALMADAGGLCELESVVRSQTPALRCLACHDGAVGSSIPFQMRADGLGRTHPVDVDYTAAAAQHPTEYVPGSQLPPSLPLVEGKVACTTCHDGQSTAPHHVSNEPDLCLACHVK